MYASYALIALLVIGFFIGFLRNMKRSLIRTIMILVSVAAAILFAPTLSKTLTNMFISGMTFSAFGTTLDFEEVARNVLSEEMANELLVNNETVTKLAQALAKIFVNVVAFVAILIGLLILTLIIYWIVSIVIHVKDRARKQENESQGGSKFGKRVLGGLFGVISAVALSFAFLMPVFGIMNVCDGFIRSETTTETEETASASNISFVGGTLYYTEDKNIGKIETAIQKYAEIKDAYNNTFAGKFFNTLGISKLGSSTFNKLTTAEIDGLTVNVTNELVSVVKLYNDFKDNFIAQEFDVTKNACIDAVWKMYETANRSEIVKSFISEFVPKIASKWSSGEKFMGIANPVPEDYKSIANEVIGIFNTTYLPEINKNLEVVKNSIKAANNNGFIASVQNHEDTLEYLSKEKVMIGTVEKEQTLVQDIFVELSKSERIKDALPNITNELFKMVYELAVQKAETEEQVQALATKFPAFTNEEVSAINWGNEAEKMQGIVTNVASIYNEIKTAEAGDMQMYLSKLESIGAVLDNAKNSSILAGRIKTFMVDFITTKVTLEENIKTQIVSQINTNWANTEFSFKTAFAGIQALANKASDLVDILNPESITSIESLNIADISDAIKDIVKDENMVSAVKELIGKGEGEDNIIANIVGEENADAVEVLTDVLDAFMNVQAKYSAGENATEEEIAEANARIDEAIDDAISA